MRIQNTKIKHKEHKENIKKHKGQQRLKIKMKKTQTNMKKIKKAERTTKHINEHKS